MTTDELITTCRTAADAALDALRWVEHDENDALVGARKPQLMRELRRFSNQCAVLAGAVDRPMCVGLFGPSQAGKSYLAAGLSRAGARPLTVRFAGHDDKNFLNQINPEGDRESTGVVTRFSLDDVPHPDGFPVALRLLSEGDVIKTLGNSYFLDSDPRLLVPMPREELEAALGRAAAMGGPEVRGFTRGQVWDLQEYFQKQFGHLSPMQAFADYWARAEDLAPRLDIAGRAVLFAPLWGAHDRLTGTYTEMITALARLDFAAEAFAGIDALIPRSASIIDVETLMGLGDPAAPALAVRTMTGAPVQIARPVLTALIAELRLVIAEKPWPMFEHTDLLDFPGARNRDPVDMAEFLSKPDALKQLLVRGKVAYLFDRYVADQELTSMLLCVKPSNQDIVSLPALVAEWIERTHGEKPEDREGKPTLLFFILGWFNEHLKNKPGEDESDLGARFKSRMKASLIDFFGKSHKWPSNWAGGRPFDNCFWLRDPGFSTEIFAQKDGLEDGLRPEEQDRIARMRDAYLEVEEVQAHFRDPAAGWDRAMLLNDGGIRHLADSLEPVCEPDMKRRQVRARIDALRTQMRASLTPFHVSDDVEKRMAERRVVADDLLEAVADLADARRFGSFLRVLQIDESALYDHLLRYQRRPRTAKAAAPAEETPAPRASRRFVRDPGATDQLVATEERSPRQPDQTDALCEEMISAWGAAMAERADSERIARDLGISTARSKEVVAELLNAARRLDLAGRIATELRGFSFPEGIERATLRSAVIGAKMIGGFVSTLGYDRVTEATRPRVPSPDGTERAVFASPPPLSSRLRLPVEPALPEEAFVDDWGYAFMALVDENAASSKGQTVNRVQNAALGKILVALGASFDTEG